MNGDSSISAQMVLICWVL